MSSIFFSKQLYFIMPLCDSVICNHGGSSVTVMTQQRVTQYLSMSLADPVCHEILYNTRSCEVAFRIKIKCSCQISLFLPHCKLWRITSLLDISTYSGSILDFISVLHSYCNMLDTTSVWDYSLRSQLPKPTWTCSIFSLLPLSCLRPNVLAHFHFGTLHTSYCCLKKYMGPNSLPSFLDV